MKQKLSIFMATVLLVLSLAVPATAADGYCVIGDVDEDGQVSILDVTRIQRTLAGLVELSVLQDYLADVDGSGGVTIIDATIIQRALADISYDFYKFRLYTWRASITSVDEVSAYVTPGDPPGNVQPTPGTTKTFYIEEVSHEIPSEFEVYVNDSLLRGRSTDEAFSYTFTDPGNYAFKVIAYDPFGGNNVYRFDIDVPDSQNRTPKIVSAIYNKNTSILSVIAAGGTVPYEYEYVIRNDVSPNPPGGYNTPTSYFDFYIDENGIPTLKCEFSSRSAVYIPIDQLTKTLNYTCEVQVRDANGNLSEIKMVPIDL
ncbi:MAG: dockerin type I repeat-containing protein [Ruminococcus sp.]|nr:dockerin type I repeat-containing protein [Ruminococcus sp.]